MDLQPLDPAACARAELLDLGSGSGRRLLDEALRFGVKSPLGVDRNRAKVTRAQASGVPVYEADFTDLDPAAFPNVKVVVFDNVLEHLPSAGVVEEVLTRTCAMVPQVVYIRHPSFEHEDYLASLGLKQYWTDWPGVHTAHVRLHEFIAMAARLGVYNFSVHPVRRASSSADATILPIGAPPNQRKQVRNAYGLYDLAAHGPKPSVSFDRPVYFAFDIFFFLGDQIPSIHYPVDPDREVTRPSLTWHAGTDHRRPGSQAAARGRRAVRRLVARTRGR
jgi:methyltransferase family protein